MAAPDMQIGRSNDQLTELTRQRILRRLAIPDDDDASLQIPDAEIPSAMRFLLDQGAKSNQELIERESITKALSPAARAELYSLIPAKLIELKNSATESDQIFFLIQRSNTPADVELQFKLLSSDINPATKATICFQISQLKNSPPEIEHKLLLAIKSENLTTEAKAYLLNSFANCEKLTSETKNYLTRIARDPSDRILGAAALTALAHHSPTKKSNSKKVLGMDSLLALFNHDTPEPLSIARKIIRGTRDNNIATEVITAVSSTKHAASFLLEIAQDRSWPGNIRNLAMRSVFSVPEVSSKDLEKSEKLARQLLWNKAEDPIARVIALWTVLKGKMSDSDLSKLAHESTGHLQKSAVDSLLKQSEARLETTLLPVAASLLSRTVVSEPASALVADVTLSSRVVRELIIAGPNGTKEIFHQLQQPDSIHRANTRARLTLVTQDNPVLRQALIESFKRLGDMLLKDNDPQAKLVTAYADALELSRNGPFPFQQAFRLSPESLIASTANKLRLISDPRAGSHSREVESAIKNVLDFAPVSTGPLSTACLPYADWNSSFSYNEKYTDDQIKAGKTFMAFTERTDTDLVNIGAAIGQAREKLNSPKKAIHFRGMHSTRLFGLLGTDYSNHPDETLIFTLSDEAKLKNLPKEEAQKLQQYIAPDEPLVAMSCNSGRDLDLSATSKSVEPADNLMKMYRRLFPRAGTIFAPEVPAALEKVTLGPDGGIESVKFADGRTMRDPK